MKQIIWMILTLKTNLEKIFFMNQNYIWWFTISQKIGRHKN